MCGDPLHDFLCALPKCEHHMHLEGSLEPSLLFELAKKNDIALPSVKDDPSFESIQTLSERYSRFTSLDDFLHYYFIGMSVLVTESDFESLAYNYFKKAHSQNVLHAEVFFDPQAHTSRQIPYKTVLNGFLAAQTRAKHDFSLSSSLIVCLLRHLPLSSSQQTYEVALPDLQSGTITGLGLSSTELNYPPSLFAPIYNDARTNGVTHLTAHAGEEADVSYMASAIHDLHVSRVDHGIKLPQDPELLRYFAEKRIMITMCPLSNLELKCVADLRELPVRTYLDAGVPFSINSDDPAYFAGGTYIQENYCAVQEAFNLSVQEWERIVKDSIEGSWCGEERKTELRKSLEKVVGEYGTK